MAWGVKTSFISYIRNSLDGEIRATDGAAETADGKYYFPLARVWGNSEQLLVILRGIVHFYAHMGLLSISIQHPRLLIRESTAELAVKGREDEWLHLAHLQLPDSMDSDSGIVWEVRRLSLTSEGTQLFGETYSEGEALAPLTIRIPQFNS